MELRDIVWEDTYVSKSMTHFPECEKCNKREKRQCPSRLVYNYYKTLYIMTRNIAHLLNDKFKDGEIEFVDYNHCIYIIHMIMRHLNHLHPAFYNYRNLPIETSVSMAIKEAILKENQVLNDNQKKYSYISIRYRSYN